MDNPLRSRPVPLLQRIMPALRLDTAFYDEVATDPSTRGQAFLVVVIAGILNGITLRERLGQLAIWGGVFAALAGWLLWTLVVHVVARVFGNRRGTRSLARTLAFANVPSFFLVLTTLPDIGWIVRLAVPVWLVITSTTAVQATYAITRTRAAVIATTAFIIYMGIGLMLGIVAG